MSDTFSSVKIISRQRGLLVLHEDQIPHRRALGKPNNQPNSKL